MRHVPLLSLLLGVPLLVSSAWAAFGIWLGAYGTFQLLLPPSPTPGFSISIAEATSLDALRKSCLGIVQAYDTQNSIILSQSAYISNMIDALLRSVLIGGIIIGSAFLYVYFATRKHADVSRS